MISFNCHIYIANTSQPDASFLFSFFFLLDMWPCSDSVVFCSDSGFSAVPVSFLVALFGIRQLAAAVRQPTTNQSWAWKTNEALFGTGRNSPAADNIWSFQLQSGFCMCRSSPASNLKVNTELGTWKNDFVWNLIRRSSLVLDGTNCRFWKIVVGVVKHLRECRNYLSFKYFLCALMTWSIMVDLFMVDLRRARAYFSEATWLTLQLIKFMDSFEVACYQLRFWLVCFLKPSWQ